MLAYLYCTWCADHVSSYGVSKVLHSSGYFNVWFFNQINILIKISVYSNSNSWTCWVKCLLYKVFFFSVTVTDPLDDIPDECHRNFMKAYLKNWPYPPQTQYKVGQIINAEYNGNQEKCEVMKVDCSLVQVVYQVSTLNIPILSSVQNVASL